ncbi:MmpS family transport accessory protein [Tsukamurella soli]|uniref:MmpS family transport accessory protein n=1 Tax=Tsukamurella soli TaxID=644556 RepID=A0ABP8K8H7_9ACTN
MSTPNPPYPPQAYPPIQPPKKRRIWPWVLLGILVVFIAIVAGCTAMVGSAVKSVSDDSKRVVHVTYKVTGDSQDATITYDMNGNTTQDSSVALPWSKQTDVTGISKYVSLLASNGIEGTGSITCQVLVDGKAIITNTASGPGASASCSGSVDTK